MNGKTRRKSPLAVYERLSPNKSIPRNKQIRRLTPHCVAGNLTIESTLGLSTFHDGKTASTGYAIGSDGRIGLGVEETNRAWTSSSSANDNEAITFEIANNGPAPDWRMSDAAINSFLDLAVEICIYYGFDKVVYKTKPASITGSANVEAWIKTWSQPDEMILTLHNWYANKSCPGPYFTRQIPWIVEEINNRLRDSARIPLRFVGENVVPPPQEAPEPQKDEIKAYTIRVTASALNVRKGPGTNYAIVKTLVNDPNVYTIVEEADGVGSSKWGKLKSGLGWVSLDYTRKT